MLNDLNGCTGVHVLKCLQPVHLDLCAVLAFQAVFRPKVHDAAVANVDAVVVQVRHPKGAFYN